MLASPGGLSSSSGSCGEGAGADTQPASATATATETTAVGGTGVVVGEGVSWWSSVGQSLVEFGLSVTHGEVIRRMGNTLFDGHLHGGGGAQAADEHKRKKVENVKLLDRFNVRQPAVGTLYLTTTHLIFVDNEGKRESWLVLPFQP
ncbi:hypothetical protein ACOMHN_045301 [Nucella lapillus]